MVCWLRKALHSVRERLHITTLLDSRLQLQPMCQASARTISQQRQSQAGFAHWHHVLQKQHVPIGRRHVNTSMCNPCRRAARQVVNHQDAIDWSRRLYGATGPRFLPITANVGDRHLVQALCQAPICLAAQLRQPLWYWNAHSHHALAFVRPEPCSIAQEHFARTLGIRHCCMRTQA